jgi:hypothetical protein
LRRLKLTLSGVLSVNTHDEIEQIITELSDATVPKPRVFIPITTGILVYDTHSVRAVFNEPQLRAPVGHQLAR